MKRIITTLLVLLFATSMAAQEKKEDDYNTIREFKNRVFTVQYRDPRDLFGTIKLLGSGFKGAGMSVSPDMKTITVRDFPENVAAIDDAIKRLDQPVAPEPDVELRLSVLIGSKTPLTAPAVPDDLSAVVKQLQATLKYPHYALMTAGIQRTKTGKGVEGSGVAEPTLLGMKAEDNRPIFYSYKLTSMTVGTGSIEVGNFQFSMRIPINVGSSIQYQSVGFETPVSLKPNEKVVIGTTTMGDKALIVVVTATPGAK
jgi:hypothetical protein